MRLLVHLPSFSHAFTTHACFVIYLIFVLMTWPSIMFAQLPHKGELLVDVIVSCLPCLDCLTCNHEPIFYIFLGQIDKGCCFCTFLLLQTCITLNIFLWQRKSPTLIVALFLVWLGKCGVLEMVNAGQMLTLMPNIWRVVFMFAKVLEWSWQMIIFWSHSIQLLFLHTLTFSVGE